MGEILSSCSEGPLTINVSFIEGKNVEFNIIILFYAQTSLRPAASILGTLKGKLPQTESLVSSLSN